MARDFFKNLPNTTTPITAPRLNGLLDGDEAMGNIVADSIQGKNLFNKNNVFVGIIYSNGGIGSSSAEEQSCRYSDYIPITKNKITLSGINTSGGGNLIEYNSNKEKIDNWNTSNRTLTLNANTKFIRMSIKSNDLNTAQLEYGESATQYSEYQGIGYVSGNNSNGNYIKYDDGTLIQWGKVFKNIALTNYSETSQWYYDDGHGVNFPIDFIDTNYYLNVIATAGYSITLNVYSIQQLNVSRGNFNLSCKVNYSSNDYPFTWFAIGRWK